MMHYPHSDRIIKLHHLGTPHKIQDPTLLCTTSQAEAWAETRPCIVMHGCQMLPRVQEHVLRLRQHPHGNIKASISTMHTTKFEAHVATLHQSKSTGVSIEHSSLCKKQQADTEARSCIVMYDSLMLAG